MQLKKRFSVRRGVVAGAMAVAMFATSLPAMASDGHGLGFKMGIGLSLHGHSGNGNEDGLEARGDASWKADLSEVRGLEKDIRKDLKLTGDWKNWFDFDASSTAQVEAIKKCRKDARDTFNSTTKSARDERDASLKTAVDAYLASLKSARATFQAANTAAGSDTAKIDAARTAYRQAILTAWQTFRDAKHAATTAYRDDTKSARETLDSKTAACKG